MCFLDMVDWTNQKTFKKLNKIYHSEYYHSTHTTHAPSFNSSFFFLNAFSQTCRHGVNNGACHACHACHAPKNEEGEGRKSFLFSGCCQEKRTKIPKKKKNLKKNKKNIFSMPTACHLPALPCPPPINE
jgi:hypothetical protein